MYFGIHLNYIKCYLAYLCFINLKERDTFVSITHVHILMDTLASIVLYNSEVSSYGKFSILTKALPKLVLLYNRKFSNYFIYKNFKNHDDLQKIYI